MFKIRSQNAQEKANTTYGKNRKIGILNSLFDYTVYLDPCEIGNLEIFGRRFKLTQLSIGNMIEITLKLINDIENEVICQVN